jgi:hypothetical protein
MFHPNDKDLSSGTPDIRGSLFDDPEAPLGAHRAEWLVLHLLFYAEMGGGAAGRLGQEPS